MKKIKINCLSGHLLRIEMLSEFQGELKSLSEENYERLKKNIAEEGFIAAIHVWTDPVDLNHYILDGHQRLRTVKKMVESKEFECEMLPVVFVNAETKDEAKHKLLSMASQYGKVEPQGLYEYISEIGMDPVDLFADFSFPEIDQEKFMAEFFDEPIVGLTDPDELPQVGENVHHVVEGDVWQLGDHRLMCGDSTNAEHFGKLMGGEKGFLMVTDPPYGVEYDPNWREEAAQKGLIKGLGVRSTGLVKNDDRANWEDVWRLWDPQIIYCWHAGVKAAEVSKSLTDCDFKIISQLIWVKPRFAISRQNYNWRHEPCWFAVKNGETQLWVGPQNLSTVIEADNLSDERTGHGTQNQ